MFLKENICKISWKIIDFYDEVWECENYREIEVVSKNWWKIFLNYEIFSEKLCISKNEYFFEKNSDKLEKWKEYYFLINDILKKIYTVSEKGYDNKIDYYWQEILLNLNNIEECELNFFDEKDFCKISWKITKREIEYNYFPDELETYIKFRIEKNWKNFDFTTLVSNWNCIWCKVSISDLELWKEKYILVNKNNFYASWFWDKNFPKKEKKDFYSNHTIFFPIFEKIEDCEFGASNVTYEIWDIDENLFQDKNLEQEILYEEIIIPEKNFSFKIDFSIIFIFVIFIIYLIFIIFVLKKLKRR